MLSLLTLSCSSTDAILKRFRGQSIVAGTAGGFSGLTEGYRLDTEGKIHRFHGRLDQRSESLAAQVDKSDAAALFQRMDDIKFMSLSYNGAGNLNSFVELRSDTLLHRVRWAPGDSLAPKPVRDFYVDFMKFIEENTKQSTDSTKN